MSLIERFHCILNALATVHVCPLWFYHVLGYKWWSVSLRMYAPVCILYNNMYVCMVLYYMYTTVWGTVYMPLCVYICISMCSLPYICTV